MSIIYVMLFAVKYGTRKSINHDIKIIVKKKRLSAEIVSEHDRNFGAVVILFFCFIF